MTCFIVLYSIYVILLCMSVWKALESLCCTVIKCIDFKYKFFILILILKSNLNISNLIYNFLAFSCLFWIIVFSDFVGQWEARIVKNKNTLVSLDRQWEARIVKNKNTLVSLDRQLEGRIVKNKSTLVSLDFKRNLSCNV